MIGACGLAADASRLAADVERWDAAIADLPAKEERDERGRTTAEEAAAARRRARAQFVAAHAGAVYDELTEGRSVYVRLPELLARAEAAFPGLVPTTAQMAREHQRRQSLKDGLEIDQALVVRGLLREPTAGRHLVDAMLTPTHEGSRVESAFASTGRLDLDTVTVERRGDAAHVTFLNTDFLNAEDGRLVADVETAVDAILLDPSTKVGVLRGGPMTHPRYAGRRVFSAGINLKELQAGRISLIEFLLGRELGYISKIVRGVLVEPGVCVQKPWVAAVDAFAIGGGMQLTLVCDHVIAAADAYFALPAAHEGIVPGAANLRLTSMVGTRIARRILLGGERIRATDADARLVCDVVVAPEAVDRAVEQAAAALAEPAVVANRRMLNLAEEPLDRFREYMAEFAVEQALRLYSSDVLAKAQRWGDRSAA